MFTLPYIFRSGALFQANVTLTITGWAAPEAAVHATLAAASATPISTATTTGDDGKFTLTIPTPLPSFMPYTLTLTCGDDCHVMEDILFGEVWLASGQSNMEFANGSNPGCDELYAAVAGKKIRVYHVDYPPYGGGGAFPWEPDMMMTGHWMTADEPNQLHHVSALGLQFVSEVYDFLNQKADVPVGFLNANWGATSITCYFNREALEQETALYARMQKIGNVPTAENWNARGDGNFQQTSAQYNCKIAPLEGCRVRGILWYQGENECANEFRDRIYADYLRAYHRMYTERFAADPDAFLMISSLIYPWTYGDSGECNVGYLNDAFVTTALEDPDKFAYAPIADLAPIWSYHQGNHPIHPANKYDVGSRMARLALTNVYGEAGMCRPATLASCTGEGNALLLRFDTAGEALRVGRQAGDVLHGLYIAEEDGIYLPAEYAIVASDTIRVWNDAIATPIHAAYAMQSLDVCVNLFCGDFPVTPFYTDKESCLRIEQRPWYDTAVNARWASRLRGDILDMFYHPVFHPLPGSEVCCDSAFRHLAKASIRVCSENDAQTFGCYVKSYPYGKLDLQKFRGLTVELYNTDHLTAELILTTADGEVLLPLTPTEAVGYGWMRYEAVFASLSDAEITRMTFRFTRDTDRYHFVNLERVRLMK